MAFGLTPAGTITKEQTLLSTRRLPVADSENIGKGQVVDINISGNVVVAATDNTDEAQPVFVALEPANNSAGSDGDISVPLAVPGHFVTVVADTAINPGDRVKRSSVAGRVDLFEPGTDANLIAIGTYFGKEGGIITKSTTSADDFAETFTDNADFVPVAAAQNDVIEVQIRD